VPLIAVLHFLADADQPHEIVRTITERLAPGSYLTVTHVTADDLAPGAALAARAAYAGASVPAVPRTRDDVERFLDGLDPVPPGVANVRCWHRPRARPRPPVLF
jgi:S-adenosyl methyltransferase